MKSNTFYPLFINLHGKKILVVGGGRVATRKCLNFLSFGPQITVVAPEICEELQKIEQISLVFREACISDIQPEIYLVVLATDDPVAQEQLSEECRKKGVLFNRSDLPEMSDFITGSIINKEPILASVISSGSPEVTKLVSRKLEDVISPELVQLSVVMNEFRRTVIEKYPDRKIREEFFKKWSSEEILERISVEGIERVREEIQKCLSQ
ncbi:MAG: bifunctional precorrin-2 dehydrogenase/sirohydrochlorin ferrochelatase [Candidatus Riflebacteria bacterium]|nr:bifunctional precorrin-2 dehydrogenase/sirohydrochlorin ferrochelatase [Candidatus Riflebacteria bacterium]